MSRQGELLALFDQTRAALDDFLMSRSREERAAPGGSSDWSAKELVALIGFWMIYMTERMTVYAQGATPSAQVDFDALNWQALAANVDTTWMAAAQATQVALANLAHAVQGASDALLMTPNVYGAGPGDPLWEEVRANGFIWPLQEMEKYYQRVGETDHAAEIHARLVAVLGEPEVIVCALLAPEALRALPVAPLIIDVRDADEYAAGHLPGAQHIPLRDLPDHLGELPQDRPIVTYCNMHHPGQSRGERAAALLAAEGYDARALAGGYPAWVACANDEEKAGE